MTFQEIKDIAKHFSSIEEVINYGDYVEIIDKNLNVTKIYISDLDNYQLKIIETIIKDVAIKDFKDKQKKDYKVSLGVS